MLKSPLIVLVIIQFVICTAYGQKKIYVSNKGQDNNKGTLEQPLFSIAAALKMASGQKETVIINLRKGVYYLDTTLVVDAKVFLPKSLTIQNYRDEAVVISAGLPLILTWQPYKNGIYQAKVPAGIHFEELFINGEKQVLARYPNYDKSVRVLQGTASDATSKTRVGHWKDPVGGYLHGLQAYQWGSLHYKILGKNADSTLQLEGGWQNNRPSSLHKDYRYVENIFEELDTTGEWFLDTKSNLLYYKPTAGLNLQAAKVVVSHLKNSLELLGSSHKPLRKVHIKGITFMHNKRSFMETKEPVLRSDWRIYRGGAVLFDGTMDCSIAGCDFYNLGGNAIMVSGFNKRAAISGCHISAVGANGICFIGQKDAVRSPLESYDRIIAYDALDKVPGPLSSNYPDSCIADNNLIDSIGLIEKQVAGITIDIAANIQVTHNTIYQVPRAGINIGDGCFGGHLIAYNSVFNTVLETGDHGAFNSWGRDRFWSADRAYMDSLVAIHPALILLDVQKKNVLRNNLFSCDHGWDIDLDDGSSNYEIFNNLCLSGGIKFREGFYRNGYNNIMVNNSFHPHVWFNNSHDQFEHNIVMTAFKPIRVKAWGDKVDHNLFLTQQDLLQARANGTDAHSVAGNPDFIDPASGNFTVSYQSPALKIGFKNFPMDHFGVELPRLKKQAAQPTFPELKFEKGNVTGPDDIRDFQGARLKSISGLGDRSAFGLPDETGVAVLSVAKGSLFDRAGFKVNDVIRGFSGTAIQRLDQLLKRMKPMIGSTKSVPVNIIRNQQSLELIMKF